VKNILLIHVAVYRVWGNLYEGDPVVLVYGPDSVCTSRACVPVFVTVVSKAGLTILGHSLANRHWVSAGRTHTMRLLCGAFKTVGLSSALATPHSSRGSIN
jgi:hypothetical protein